MKHIVYTRPDGGVSVITPATGFRLCASATHDGVTHKFSPPWHFDNVRRLLKTDALHVEWAETEDEFVSRVMAKDVPEWAADPIVVDGSDIPDKSFREAWARPLGGGISVDMERARAIHRDRLREARKPLLEALDVEYQRADEQGDAAAKKRVAAKKAALRDVTADPAIDAANTPDELFNVVPSALRF